MKGLELAERYYFEVCAPMLQKKFPDWMKRMAAGLVGDGSECYGYDDELSRDHDWGAEMCLWLTDEDYAAFGNEVAAEVSKGVAQVALKSGKPEIFGVLTTDSIDQALERAGTKAGNKGFNAASSALEMINLLKEMGNGTKA